MVGQGPSMKLTYEESRSSLWLKIKDYAESRVSILRSRNDSVSLTPEQTSALRGQIKEMKILLESDSDAGATSED